MSTVPVIKFASSPHRIYGSRRVVIKIGSALLVDKKSGLVRTGWMESLAVDLNCLRHAGVEVLIVSSGAIALGCRRLGINHIRSKIKARQPTAAIGQIILAHAYQEVMFRHDITTAQILLSTDNTEQRKLHLYLRSTINDLLALGVVPVINENDTVSTTGFRFGDNDRLGARLAQLANADTLIILSDIDGLYTADPRSNSTAHHIPEVKCITSEIEAMAGDAGSNYTSGGMITKLAAAKIAATIGCRTVISNGLEPNPIYRIDNGARCTWFHEFASSLTTRKRWIASSLDPRGQLILDAGALDALIAGKSLLPAGVIEVVGTFERGDVVTLHAPDGALCGRGLISYASHDARQIAGLKSCEIETILGYCSSDEIVHRNDLVLIACSIPK
ncbi:glutamate 5-kinase [Candidatus Endolissoclinum faulkneri L5]|uniref:Glutamate 5-kinase n=1 Tax=Candidatus Endolissoclinum faulkneri L5 TaxID=1401328 RepID=V9TUG7_9PROT|nr:glutamate 5-kinase [Candidatus Endolissoclinum faulkneri]AHC73792.1 glutamate 5-kinase [Candidatus Endolissoclinum faulkneri L5]